MLGIKNGRQLQLDNTVREFMYDQANEVPAMVAGVK